MYYADDIVSLLTNSEQILIYGARIVAAEVAHCLLNEPYNLKISGFVVSDLSDNPSDVYGIKVYEIKEAKKLYPDAVVLIAVLERYLNEIKNLLKNANFQNIISVTFDSDLWAELRGNYFRFRCLQQKKPYLTLEEELEKVEIPEKAGESGVHIYMAKSHKDQKLRADLSKYNWEIPIQVGASLTKERIARIRDNEGDNISDRNKEYCELTALYWIWKNDCSKYVGLCHYRRHFALTPEQLLKLEYSDIDVILTIPVLNFPNVRTIYCNDHDEKDWDIMLEAVQRLCPDYMQDAEKVQGGDFYYGYNMLIARKDIFNDYCKWLFPILEYCAQRCGKKENTYQNRYIGFLAERLLTIYFSHYEDSYKIVHAQKNFLM